MNTAKATQIAKTLGYGKVFVRQNGEICMENRAGKVVLTMNPDFSIKYSRHNMDQEAEALKNALGQQPTLSQARWIKGDHTAPGHYVHSTGDYTKDVLSGFFQE